METFGAKDERLSNGSIIHWSERDPGSDRRAMVTCGNCGKKRMTSVPLPTHTSRKNWGGLCMSCGRRQFKNAVPHHSGSIIHWNHRDPENPKYKVAITCHGCKSEKYNWVQIIKDPAWSGLCHDCIQSREPHNKFLHDEPLPLTGSIIHWGQASPDNPDYVMVTCGLCLRRRPYQRAGLLTNTRGKRGGEWTGYCTRQDRLHCIALFKQRSAKQAGIEQSFENRVEQAIKAVWERVRVIDVPFDKRLRLVTGIEIAASLNLGSAGEQASADQLRKKLERDGVKNRFPGVKQWFPAFVRSVVERVEANRTTCPV